MKMLGNAGEEDLIVLIDSRVTKTFISNWAVRKSGITREEYEKFEVILGNGDEILGQEYVRG